MMSYNYDTNNSKRFVNSYLYTLIDEDGIAKNIEEIDTLNNFSSQIDKDLVSQIIEQTNADKESFYKFHYVPPGCYLGPIFRFRINYKNGTQMSFIFRDKDYDKGSKYYLFKSLFDQITEPSKIKILKPKELKILYSRFEDYKTFVYHKDTLELPLPPPPPLAPKIEEVMYTK